MSTLSICSKNHGDICAIKKINDPKDAAASFRAEFIDCRDAKRAAIAMHGYRVMVHQSIIVKHTC